MSMMLKSLGIFAAMAMSMGSGGYCQGNGDPYTLDPRPVDFSFKRFRQNGEKLPKGCKMETVTLEFIKPTKPKYKISVNADIVFASQKAGQKRLIQFHREIEKLRQYPELTIEEVLEEPDGNIIIGVIQ